MKPMKVPRSVNDGRRRRRWWILPLLALLGFIVVRGLSQEPERDPEPTATPDAPVTPARDRVQPPTVGGTRLPLLDQAARPLEPAQWSEGSGPVPFSQWWSGLETGPGIPALWSEPLLLRMNEEGRADLSAPTYTTRPDGFRDADIVPAMFFEFGPDAVVRVIDHGSFHVRFTVTTTDVDATITMVQGSPFVEVEGEGVLALTVPALSGLDDGVAEAGAQRFTAAAGSWLLASSEAVNLGIEGDRVDLSLRAGVRHAIGPAPAQVDDRYDDAAAAVAAHPLVGTFETLTVDSTGTVRQTLEQRRTGEDDTAVAWALLPHHEDFVVGSAGSLGSIESLHGTTDVVLASSLVFEYPPVPIVWDAVTPDGFDPSSLEIDDLPPIPEGSYFGGKGTATAAAVHDVLAAAGDSQAAGPFLDSARNALGLLFMAGSQPELTWDPGWGSVVIAPAEFGADTQLNDHQLQNGYWVGAAASVVVADPTQRTLLEDGIDLLIADYAGADLVPHLQGVVSDESTWSSFAGHSWASGVGGFSAGNNLESVSESSYAWWAAAKWFLATNRPELADAFIARLTIESWLTGYEWLPTRAHQSSDPSLRPWSGVVWASKVDPGTWFDASDEAALGIRLLPIGPQAFSRYPDGFAVEAAEDRWDWCEQRGDGCVERWWNLLDADAAVAGRGALPVSEAPEESTTEIVRRWWRAHWEQGSLAAGWRCPPGTTVRQTNEGAFVALVTNPSSTSLAVTCEHDQFGSFENSAEPRSSALVPLESGS